MQLREEAFINVSSLAELQDIVTTRAVDLRRSDHAPLDEKEIWWALEATLRLINQENKAVITI
jgi:hypothetical protein